MRMIRWKPRMPPATTSAATASRATTLVAVPPPQPSWVNTVAVASVASETSTVSQPTVSTQESTAGTRLPFTPNAARLSTRVGAEPRLPAIAMNPQSRKDTTMPTTPATTACQAEDADVGPEPGPEQLARGTPALALVDDVDAVELDGDPRGRRLDRRAGEVGCRLRSHRRTPVLAARCSSLLSRQPR